MQGVAKMKEACAQFNLDPYDVAIRWLVHHSMLRRELDGIIVGCSTVSSLKKNVASAAHGQPLPPAILPLLEEAAKLTKIVWPLYFR